MANQVDEAVRTVMAVREYQDREVPEAVLRRVVEAAHLTASASNAQPWHFILIREREALRKLGALIRTGGHTARAAAAVIVAYEKSSGAFGVSNCSPRIQSKGITPWGDGAGPTSAAWVGGGDGRGEVGLPGSPH